MTPTKTLLAYLDDYLSERDLASSSIKQLQYSLTNFGKFLGYPATPADLNRQAVNGWLIWLADHEKLRPRSIKNRRINVMTIWRWLYDIEVLQDGPRRVRKVVVPPSVPVAWTIREAKLLLAVCDKLKGILSPVAYPRNLFWRAFIMTAYDTGLRRCDLLLLLRDQIGERGRLILIQKKTNWPVTCTLGTDTLKAVDATMRYPRDLLFGDLTRDFVSQQFRSIVLAAGLKGSLHKLRKTSVTAVEIVSPGAGQSHLGHKSSDMAKRFYIDPLLAGAERPLPPRLTTPDDGDDDAPPAVVEVSPRRPVGDPLFGGSIDTSSL